MAEPDCRYYTWYGEGEVLEYLCLLLTSCPHTHSSCSNCHSGPDQCQQLITSTTSTSPPTPTSTPSTQLTALLISGGYGPSRSAELYLPQSGAQCELPEIGQDFAAHTADNLTLCGGDFTRTSCVSLTEEGWVTSSNLLQERYYHSSWASPSGLRLLGSAVLANLKTTEVLLQNGTSQQSFTLQYNTE